MQIIISQAFIYLIPTNTFI